MHTMLIQNAISRNSNLVQNDYSDSMRFLINYGYSKSCLLQGELICIPIVSIINAIDIMW